MTSEALPDISSLLDQGIALHQAGRLDHAERLYRSVLARDPDQVDALTLLGTVAMQRV